MKKKIGFLILAIILIFVGKYVYDMNINHNFETITEGKVYKSGVIPPDLRSPARAAGAAP